MCWVSSDEPPTKRRCRCGLRRPRPRPIFPPVKRGLAHHGIAVRSALTCNGHVQVRRRRYENIDGSTATLTDELIDLADCGVSLAAREMCCRIAIDSGSFVRASANLGRLAQLQLSDEKLRQLSETEGRAVTAWQEQEQLEFDFDAGSWLTTQTADGSSKSRIYVGIDGFMLPMVTDTETGKRFEKAQARRKRLKRSKGLRRPQLRRGRGADQRYKEMKLVTMYDQE